ncbi:MAG: hypothetical protein P1U89_26185 [Verrucomicrobiales bacterium]|nr:hypothetical protein [Verrucomicrobiales bacterium]
MLKEFTQLIGVYHPIRNILMRSRDRAELAKWEENNRPVPPPHIVKQIAILDYSAVHNCSVLVETGTYLGDMVDAMKGRFSAVHTIELDDELFKAAKKRFKNDANVNLYHGDSGVVLDDVLAKLNDSKGRAIFWLDGHYSGEGTAESECPIVQEVRKILAARENDVILIDDAHCFGKMPDYPTIEELKSQIVNDSNQTEFKVENNIIYVLPLSPHN